MEFILIRLENAGPSIAMMLLAGGLLFGLFGWRLARALVVIDGIAVAILAGHVSSLSAVPLVEPWLLGLLIGGGLIWLAWRHPQWALIAMGGTVGFILPQLILSADDLPLLVRILGGMIVGGMIMAWQMAVRREAMVVVTGVHGGLLVLAALVAACSSPAGYGGPLLSLLSAHDIMLPLAALCISAILITIQWAVMERSTNPTGLV